MLLRTINLEKSYGSYQVLRGLNLAVREGNIYGFLGRNGAGKTTTIQMLMGIQKPDGGALELFGKRVKRPTITQKRHIGYVSQEQFFYPWMSCAYLGKFVSRFYPTWDQAWFQHLLKVFDLPPKRKVINLSQGMRVKLALALALAHRPEMLILDEPTSGLDPAARREFLELVRFQANSEGRTTFFSSHIVEEVERISTRIGILEEGLLCYEGDLQTLRETVRGVTFGDPGRQLDAEEQAMIDAGLADFEVLVHQEYSPDYVLRGDARAWATLGMETRPLDLEDIFLALTVDRIFA